jgi:hypothetical protein
MECDYTILYPGIMSNLGRCDLAEILLQISSASDERIREIKLALNEPS